MEFDLNYLFADLKYTDLLKQVAQFILWSAFLLILVWLINKAIDRTVEDNELRYKSKKVTRGVSILLITILAILSFTGKLQYFTIAIGILSAGVALALQDVILSIAGWISIMSSKTFKTGDRIEINGIKGDVIDIGITKTTLMEIGEWVSSDNYTGRIVQVSNGFIYKGSVHNYSKDFPFLWDQIKLPIHYNSDVDLARKILKDTAEEVLIDYANTASTKWHIMVKKYLIENANVQPTISESLNDNWIDLNLRYVVNYDKRRSTKDELFKRILTKIVATNGKVNLASTTIEITKVPNINIDQNKS